MALITLSITTEVKQKVQSKVLDFFYLTATLFALLPSSCFVLRAQPLNLIPAEQPAEQLEPLWIPTCKVLLVKGWEISD